MSEDLENNGHTCSAPERGRGRVAARRSSTRAVNATQMGGSVYNASGLVHYSVISANLINAAGLVTSDTLVRSSVAASCRSDEVALSFVSWHAVMSFGIDGDQVRYPIHACSPNLRFT